MTVLLASVGATFQHVAGSGSLVLAVPVALLAGLVSFLSPCVLPLVPGYLSYVTGMSGADLATASPRPTVGQRVTRGRVLAGCALFVLGFSVVFVSGGALFGGLGRALLAHEQLLSRILGALTIVLGLVFLGALPGLSREWRIHRLPAAGLAGAPVLGFLFGLGWTPCIGPTLGAVLALAGSDSSATAGRGALLTLAYCLGLGVPFLVAALGFRRALGAFAAVRRHSGLVTRLGGGFLVAIGLLLVTGAWGQAVLWMQVHYSGFTPAV